MKTVRLLLEVPVSREMTVGEVRDQLSILIPPHGRTYHFKKKTLPDAGREIVGEVFWQWAKVKQTYKK